MKWPKTGILSASGPTTFPACGCGFDLYLPAASGGSALDAAFDFLTRRDAIAGRSYSKDHCPVHENGQAHGSSAASGAEKVPATPGQGQKHAAPRPAEPKAA